ncbi:hypothetical protein AYW79_01395 [Ferroacidibacillus organovorans]|uniref:DSBA-like thioredoxin domain-containing protein n=1 Tax=Ferroacidibacillus organovorans TaxID=1765683 RepID=A0A853KFK9_9BACL|nr:hypothetical protein AYJ22_00795 [Ferroacidibacillus organovorans]OAG95124.1 hypothetical protein AYW79_01395 [Ferroacidibacillus organovorans]
MRLEERFPAASLEQMQGRLRASGKALGLSFGNLELLSNSRLALMASEFARDKGVFHDFHQRIFDAYFRACEDIGKLEVLLSMAGQCGLDPDELKTALADLRYMPRLEQAQREGAKQGVTGTPTFIINDTYKVVGAQPFEVFRNALHKISEGHVE